MLFRDRNKPLCLALAIAFTMLTTIGIDRLAAGSLPASPLAGTPYPAAPVLA